MNEVEQLEILKTDYLGMKLKVQYNKFMLGGHFDGKTITESMHFANWDKACNWAGKATMSLDCPFVILDMTNLTTGEKEHF